MKTVPIKLQKIIGGTKNNLIAIEALCGDASVDKEDFIQMMLWDEMILENLGNLLPYFPEKIKLHLNVPPITIPKFLHLAEKISLDCIKGRLVLEMLETNIHRYSKNIRLLASAGYTLALDDFGSRGANEETLFAHPASEIEIIKLDKVFVKTNSIAEISVICKRLKSRGYKVYIEGVEDTTMVEPLLKIADGLQGYALHLPKNYVIKVDYSPLCLKNCKDPIVLPASPFSPLEGF